MSKERIGRKCFNCHSIYGCKMEGFRSYDCVTCDIRTKCVVICKGNTTGGACPACMKIRELIKMIK